MKNITDSKLVVVYDIKYIIINLRLVLIFLIDLNILNF